MKLDKTNEKLLVLFIIISLKELMDDYHLYATNLTGFL
jgi:hypothetical protein